VVYLNRLFETYGPKGLRIIALTLDSASEVEPVCVKDWRARYAIGCDVGFETFASFVRPNETAKFPYGYLVDVVGKVVGHGEQVGEELFAKALEDFFDPSIGRPLHAALADARASYEKGEIGKAWAEAVKAEADPDAVVAADAKHLRARCEAHGAFARRQAEKRLAAKDIPGAVRSLDGLAKTCAGMEVASWAAEKRREIQADPAARRELMAWQELEKIIEKEQKAAGDSKKRTAVRKAYEALVKKYPGTAAGRSVRV
jgi:hypothetical protein